MDFEGEYEKIQEEMRELEAKIRWLPEEGKRWHVLREKIRAFRVVADHMGAVCEKDC